ncbi:MAG: hypothetical protein ACLRVT_00020 [Oscillospiraceae bacterium]
MWVPRWRQASAIGLAVIWMTLSFILYIWLWFGWPYRRDWDFNSACADTGTILLEDTCRYSAAIVHGVVVRRQESVLMPGYSRMGTMYTRVAVKPIEMYKGNCPMGTVDFWEDGGVSAMGYDKIDVVQPVHVGDEIILFLTWKGTALHIIHIEDTDRKSDALAKKRELIRRCMLTAEERGIFSP